MGIATSFAVDIETKFTLGVFVAEVDFAGRSFDALGGDDEVVDQFLHAHEDAFFFGKQAFGFGDVDGAAGNAGDGLDEDFVGLAQLFKADEVAVVTIADRTQRNVEVEVFVSEIGVGFPQIVVDSGSAQIGPGEAVGEGTVGFDNADVLGAVEEDLVPGEEIVDFVEVLGEFVEELLGGAAEPVTA